MVQKDLWNKLKQRLKEVSIAAADFTEEQALIGKLKFEILTLKRRVDRLHTSIGIHVCDMSKQNPRSNPFEEADVIHYICEVEDLERQIEVKRSEITEVADHFRTKSSESKVARETKHSANAPVTPPFVPPEESVIHREQAVKTEEANPATISEKKPRKPRKAATKKSAIKTDKVTPKVSRGRTPKDKMPE